MKTCIMRGGDGEGGVHYYLQFADRPYHLRPITDVLLSAKTAESSGFFPHIEFFHYDYSIYLKISKRP